MLLLGVIERSRCVTVTLTLCSNFIGLVFFCGAQPHQSPENHNETCKNMQDMKTTIAFAEIPCGVVRVNAHDLDPDTFERRHRRSRVPVIVENWTQAWPAHHLWTEGGFAQRFSTHQLLLKHQHVPKGEADSIIRTASVQQWIDEPEGGSMRELLAFEIGDYNTYRALGPDVQPVPKALMNVFGQPVFTIGRNYTGSSVHNHEEAWVAQVVGTKAWILADSSTPPAGRGDDENPCDVIQRLKRKNRDGLSTALSVCMVYPGDVIYVPHAFWHGTCNFGDITVGVGGRGDSTGCPLVLDLAHRCDLKGLRAAIENGEDAEGTCPRSKLRPLHAAVQSGCLPIIKFLLSKKGRKGKGLARWNSFDIDGRMPHDWAAYHGHIEIIDFFMGRLDSSMFERAMQEAALNGMSHIIQRLIAKRVSVMGGNHPEGLSALELSSRAGHVEAAKLLATQMPLTKIESGKKTAIVLATEFGHSELVDWLVSDIHIDAKRPSSSGVTPAHLAAQEGHAQVLDVLVSKGNVNLEAEGPNNLRPIHLATFGGNVEALQVLLKHRVDLEAPGPDGTSALQAAAHFGHEEKVTLLLQNRANTNRRNDEGRTALHDAAQSGHMYIVKQLTSFRVNLTTKDLKGESAWKIAREKGHRDVADFLERLQK